MSSRALHLAVALDGAGWHPAAWRLPTARPHDLFTAGYWTDLVRRAEQGLIDFVTMHDALALQGADDDERVDEVRGRLDAVLIAARVAPVTSRVGLVPTATVTHTEPFHLAKAIATLDYVSTGRAGWQVQVSAGPAEARHFGRRTIPGPDLLVGDVPGPVTDPGELFAEAGDAVEVVRRLWDSWEDDAEIRDVATGRFIDRTKLHYIDFEGSWFNVRGPSITPRPPQGQPVAVALADAPAGFDLASTSVDVVLVTPHDNGQAAAAVAAVTDRRHQAGRPGISHVFADLVVHLDHAEARAQERWDQLQAWSGRRYASEAELFVGTPDGLADLLLARADAGLTGFRLRPAALPTDLDLIVDALVPELQRRGVFRDRYEAGTLRGLLGLPRPANRYAHDLTGSSDRAETT